MEWMYVGSDKKIGSVLEGLEKTKNAFRVEVEHQGKKAVAKLLEHAVIPSVILIDQDLQDIKSKSLVQFIKNHEQLAQSMIILVCANFNPYDKRQYARLGVHQCLSVGTDLNSVKESINHLINSIGVDRALHTDL